MPTPNIVCFWTDDEPRLDGNILIDRMPNAKALFKTAGVTFARYFLTTALCAPSRATSFRGEYASRHGVTTNNFRAAMQWTDNLPAALRRAGYFTSCVGKWLNQWGQDTDPDSVRVPLGWDPLGWRVMDDPDFYEYNLLRGQVDGSTVAEFYGTDSADYSTDVLALEAVDVIADCPNDQPLFLWFAVAAPHKPQEVAPRYIGAACDAGSWQPPNWNEENVADKPAYIQAITGSQRPQTPEDLCNTVRCHLATDDAIATVRNAMIADGRADTIYLYASDNGFFLGEHRMEKKNGPHDAANHVQFYAHWTGNMGAAPRTVTDQVMNVDLAATLLDITGATIVDYDVQGVSWQGHLDGTQTTPIRADALIELPVTNANVPVFNGLITNAENELYVEYETGEREYYDRDTDPYELASLHDDPLQEDRVEELHLRLQDLIGPEANTVNATWETDALTALGIALEVQVGAGGGLEPGAEPPFTTRTRTALSVA